MRTAVFSNSETPSSDIVSLLKNLKSRKSKILYFWSRKSALSLNVFQFSKWSIEISSNWQLNVWLLFTNSMKFAHKIYCNFGRAQIQNVAQVHLIRQKTSCLPTRRSRKIISTWNFSKSLNLMSHWRENKIAFTLMLWELWVYQISPICFTFDCIYCFNFISINLYYLKMCVQQQKTKPCWALLFYACEILVLFGRKNQKNYNII